VPTANVDETIQQFIRCPDDEGAAVTVLEYDGVTVV
jgi:hypothetical protein